MSMKTTKITIRNLFGIKETTLDGRSVEITGPKGSGKTSVLDAIRYALTNRSDRDYIIHRGADEGEIIIETDTGLTIDRKTRATRADTIKVKDGTMLQTRPAEFLSGIFTPLQLNPVQFTQLSRQEKNRVILNLIEFSWDMNCNGNCLLLDDGEECVCVQSISYSLLCRWFKVAVLPLDAALCAEITKGRDEIKRCAVCGAAFTPNSNRAKYCPDCAVQVRRKKEAERQRKRYLLSTHLGR